MSARPRPNLTAVPTSTTKSAPTPDRSFTKRWKHEELFEKGFVVVPSYFFRLYAQLKPYPLSSGEALLVLHLMVFKWDSSAPYPGYNTLAERMGMTDKMVRRHAKSLETKGYLRRVLRKGETNRFDLEPLFDALLAAVNQRKQIKSKKAKKRSP